MSDDFARRLLEGGLTKDELLAPLAPPRAIGRYEIVRLLGQGAAGEVWLARDPSINREVAIKLLRATDLDRRFQREIEVLGTLKHPNIVTVFDAGVENGRPWFAMERLDGGPLADALPTLDRRRRVEILLSVALACHAAHGKGVIHRDLKPTNILLDKRGPVVTDFGIAKVARDDARMTATGTAIGTPTYMSPEQAEGRAEAVDARSDVYSLGVILYEMLAGRVPFAAPTVFALTRKIVEEDPPRIDGSELEAVALKAMEKRPERRYASARDLASDLSAWLLGQPVSARAPGRMQRVARWLRRRPALTAAVAAVLVTIVVAGVLVARSAAERRRIESVQRRVFDEVGRIEAWDQNLFKPAKLVSYDDLKKSLGTLLELERSGHAPPAVHYGMARARARLGRPDLAMADLENALRRAPPRDAARYHFERALLRWEVLLRLAIAKEPTEPAQKEVVADLQAALDKGLDDPWKRDYADALLAPLRTHDETAAKTLATCERLRTVPGKPAEEAWKLQGDIYLLLKQPDKAVASFLEALKIRQSYVQAMSGLSMAYFASLGESPNAEHRARLDASLEAAARAVEINPAYAETYYIFALVCRPILRASPEKWGADREVPQAFCDRAIDILTRGLPARPDLAAVPFALGCVQLLKGTTLMASQGDPLPSFDAAVAAFEKSRALAPRSADHHIGLGLALGVRASLQVRAGADPLSVSSGAEAAFLEAAKLAPASPDPHRWLGHVHFTRKEYTRAIADWQKAIELDASLKEELEPRIAQARKR